MNTRYDAPLNGYLLPDPWTTHTAPYPDELLPYFHFVQRNVQEHTNERVALGRRDYARFLRFMVGHGLSAPTAGAIIHQLLRERNGRFRWQRTVLLDRLQWDLFHFYYRKTRPAFATFFLNSTAHLQHMYWRNMEPERFRIRPTEGEQAELSGAVLFGYQAMDTMLGRFLRLAGDDATIILCTALSQQPCLIYEDQGGKTAYRPRRFEDLLDFAGVNPPYTVAPVMAEQFHVLFHDEARAQAAERSLRALRVDGAPVLMVRREGASLFAGCVIHTQLALTAQLTNGEHSCPFFDILYQMPGLKSGMHHGEGFLWMRTPTRDHRVTQGKVPLRSVAPTILRLLGRAPPASMRAEPLV